MTNKNKSGEGKKSLEDFVSRINELQEIGSYSERAEKHPLPETREKYRSKLRDYAYNIAKQDPDYTAASPEKMSDKEVEIALAKGRQMASDASTENLKNNLDGILASLPNKGLEALLSDKETINLIVGSTKEGDREIVLKYLSYTGTKQAIENYEKNGSTGDEKMDKRVITLALEGIQEEHRKKMADLKLSRETQELSAQLIVAAFSAGNYSHEKIKTYALAGLRKEMEENFKDFKEEQAYDAIRNSLKELAKSEVPKLSEKARELVYSAAAYKGQSEDEE